jgi:hypothetical protein
VSYPDAAALGLQGSFLTPNTFPVGGVGGSVDIDVTMPVGFFMHGLQALGAGGSLQPPVTHGQGNFAAGANSLFNAGQSNNVPTVIGAPMLAYFGAYVRNSQRIETQVCGRAVSSPAVTFFTEPELPAVTNLGHKIFLQLLPEGGGLFVQYVPDVFGFDSFDPLLPSFIVAGLGSALFFTASDVVLSEGASTSRGKMMVDSGAQATILGRVAAAELDLDLAHPDFEVDVQGIGGIVTAPGFVVDQLRVPAEGGAVVWTHVPLIVLDVGGPTGGSLYGVFGANLLAYRDWVFSAFAPSPYLDVTDPVVVPELRFTGARRGTNGCVELDWHNQPAPPALALQQTDDLTAQPPAWATAATGALATIHGTFSVTGVSDHASFRMIVP